MADDAYTFESKKSKKKCNIGRKYPERLAQGLCSALF